MNSIYTFIQYRVNIYLNDIEIQEIYIISACFENLCLFHSAVYSKMASSLYCVSSDHSTLALHEGVVNVYIRAMHCFYADMYT